LREAAKEALVSHENVPSQNQSTSKRKRAVASTPASMEKRSSARTKGVVVNYNENENDVLRGLLRCVT
jgi:hypothetical protein